MTQQTLELGIQAPRGDAITRKRDVQMARVLEAAERHRARFRADASAFVLAYLAEHGPTSGEDLTYACKAAGITAHDDRAFGPVLGCLSRAKQIVKVGQCQRIRGNYSSGGNVWSLNR